jgi:hypothetical protein
MGRLPKGQLPQGRIPQVAVKIPPAMRNEMDEELVRHRKETGDIYRIADFIRDAIAEKLARIKKQRAAAEGPGLQRATG